MNQTHKLSKAEKKQMMLCLCLAITFLAFGLISYALRNEGLGKQHLVLSVFLGSAPSLFHGGFFLALVEAFDIGLQKLKKNVLICLAIITVFEIFAIRIWWNSDTGLNFWEGVADVNDILFGFLGVALSFVILKGLAKKAVVRRD